MDWIGITRKLAVPVGSKLQGPDGQFYTVVEEIVYNETMPASAFKAGGGAPDSKGGKDIPVWVFEDLARFLHQYTGDSADNIG